MNVSMLTFSVDICNLEGVYLVNLQINDLTLKGSPFQKPRPAQREVGRQHSLYALVESSQYEIPRKLDGLLINVSEWSPFH